MPSGRPGVAVSGEVTFETGKDTITSAPKIDPDGELSEAEEQELFAHYGLDYSQRRSPTGLPETGGQPMTETTGQAPASGDDAMTRSEERMRVGTATEPVGRARLRKYVVTEQVQQTVPVSSNPSAGTAGQEACSSGAGLLGIDKCPQRSVAAALRPCGESPA